MSDERKSGKRPSFFGGIKQKLVDDLLSAAQRNKNESGEIDSDKLRRDQLAILTQYDSKLESVDDIISNLKTDVTAVHAFADGGARTLDELLVSADPVPFKTFSDLDERFGALPKGFSYRYLVPPTQVVDEAIANVANNIIRLPSSFNLVIGQHFAWYGDEIPGNSFDAWLACQPAEVNRLWSMRVLSLFGILEKSELPASQQRAPGTVLMAGKQRQLADMSDPKVSECVQNFKESAVMQYDGEVDDRDTEAHAGVLDKRVEFKNLLKIGPQACRSLASLFDDADIGVRASAATYLLPSITNLALPVLQETAASWPAMNDDRTQRAAYHAQQAIWMYEDGDLEIPQTPSA